MTMKWSPSFLVLFILFLSGCGDSQSRTNAGIVEDKERTISEMQVRAIAQRVATADLVAGTVKYAQQWNDDVHTAELRNRMKQNSVQVIFLGDGQINELESVYWSTYNRVVENGFHIIDLRAEFNEFARGRPIFVEDGLRQ